MGAMDFRHVAAGQTAGEAFDRAVREARYEHGHGGYTGTIAEKSSYLLFNTPPLITEDEFWRLVDGAIQPPGPTIPEGLEAARQRLEAAVDDKWGPAAAMRLPPHIEEEWREKHGVDPKLKVYVFFGWASS
jgi:hypothetical protein